MPAKVKTTATTYREIDRWEGGVGWIAHPEEVMQRASHAIATGEGVWLVDPVDARGIDDLIASVGEVGGVVVLSNHHARDAETFAQRYGVPVTLPQTMTGVAEELAVTVERLPIGGRIGRYELLEVAHSGSEFWQEYALWDGETLVASDSVGGAPYMRVGEERLGVMTMRRLVPPRDAFGDLTPERVLSGHGSGVEDGASEALHEALTTSRRRFPRALLENGVAQVRTVVAAIRS